MISLGLEFLLDAALVCEADRHKNKFVPGSDKQDIKLCTLALLTGDAAPSNPGHRLECPRHTGKLWSARADTPDWR